MPPRFAVSASKLEHTRASVVAPGRSIKWEWVVGVVEDEGKTKAGAGAPRPRPGP